MATPKKPTVKPTVKPAAKAAKTKPTAAFKPVAEATPRYAPTPVAPKAAPAPVVADDSLELSARFWWAQTWRTIVVVVPANLLLQFMLIAFYGEPEGPDNMLGFLMMALILAVNVLVQVAVLRYMLRKKHFKGFTFSLTRR
jgi:hypothetical protein